MHPRVKSSQNKSLSSPSWSCNEDDDGDEAAASASAIVGGAGDPTGDKGGDNAFVPFELREDERLVNGDVTARRSDENWFVSLSQEPKGGVVDK